MGIFFFLLAEEKGFLNNSFQINLFVRLLGKVSNQLRGDESEAQSFSNHLLMHWNIRGCFNFSSIMENGKSCQKHPSKHFL